MRRALLLCLALAVVAAIAGGSLALAAPGTPARPRGAAAAERVPDHAELPPLPRMRPHVVEPRAGEGASPADVRAADTPAGVAPAAPPPGRPSRSASRTSRRAAHLPRLVSAPGAERALVVSDGTALPPLGAPAAVRAIIAAGNVIARTPYKWGGGHGRWQDTGYDCSGSVSYALAAAGLLDGPLTSGALMSWGGPGPGRWVTVYANAGHTFLEVAGVRFDTSGAQRTGSRWQPAQRSTAGFAVRHPAGL